MLKIAASIALVAGAVVLGLLVLLVLALVPRARVDVGKTRDGPLELTVRYGWIRLRLLPRKKKPKPAKEPSPKPKKPPGKPKKEKGKKGGFSIKNLDIGDTVCLALDILIELRNRLVIHRLRADVMLATGDAAKTGILLGQIAAVSGMILPLFEQNFIISDFQISVDGDFQAEKPDTRAAFAVAVSIRPIHLPLILLKFRRQLLALWRAVRTAPEKSDKTTESDTITPQNDSKKENVT